MSVEQHNSAGRVCTCDMAVATFVPEVRVYHEISLIRTVIIRRCFTELLQRRLCIIVIISEICYSSVLAIMVLLQ